MPPEHLAPGVHVEEVDVAPKSIEGVATSTSGFLGATRSRPVLAVALSTGLAVLLWALTCRYARRWQPRPRPCTVRR